jgi:hypothetical protein
LEYTTCVFFLNGHIEEGKRHLNFSSFAGDPIRRQYKLFDEINEEVKSGEMPLTSYLLLHSGASLSDSQKIVIANWCTSSRQMIESKYPTDSLRKK